LRVNKRIAMKAVCSVFGPLFKVGLHYFVNLFLLTLHGNSS